MEGNPQEHLAHTIENDTDTLEFIRHQDLHYWIYINGQMTDARFPRHLNLRESIRENKLYINISYGESQYNKKKITNFFKIITPEYFL